jgi:glycosyltransferase involved in cell wall biosynthesis
MAHKICIITTVHPPFDTRIFHKQAKTLVQAGYDVTLIAQHDRDEVVEGVRIIGLPKPRNRFIRIFGLTWRAFRLALRQRANIYHFHDPELLLVGVLLKLFTGAKLIYDVHENVRKQILNKAWLPAWTRKLLSAFYVLIERICLPFIDKTIIAEDSYIENYHGRKNVVAVRNYPLLSYFVLRNEGVVWPYKMPENTFNVIYVGGVTRVRGSVELVKALQLVKLDGYQKVKLFLVGPVTSAGLKEDLEVFIQKHELKDYVYMPGSVSHEKVPGLLAQAHVGVAVLHPDPNYIESLPTKLFEYMAAGLPVISSNFPLWKEIVEGNECGITVDPLNPKKIAEAIEYLLNHPEERQRMGENGRRAVLEKYNWETESAKLLKLYEELLG